tara:strand:+ start:306 stop:509 length:204 start_codon:yes stop_codon:yes gene_type:complete
MHEQLIQFIHKKVKLFFDVGYGNNYVYCGEVLDINSETLTLLDRKIGRTLLSNERITQIYEFNEGNQ